MKVIQTKDIHESILEILEIAKNQECKILEGFIQGISDTTKTDRQFLEFLHDNISEIEVIKGSDTLCRPINLLLDNRGTYQSIYLFLASIIYKHFSKFEVAYIYFDFEAIATPYFIIETDEGKIRFFIDPILPLDYDQKKLLFPNYNSALVTVVKP